MDNAKPTAAKAAKAAKAATAAEVEAEAAAAAEGAAPKQRPSKFQVKNTSNKPLNLINGTIKPGEKGIMTQSEYSYLYKRVDLL